MRIQTRCGVSFPTFRRCCKYPRGAGFNRAPFPLPDNYSKAVLYQHHTQIDKVILLQYIWYHITMPSVQWSQVNQTNPSPYDQIFILSEAVINDSFKDMFPQPVAFTRQDKEALQTRRTGQWISGGQVGPPSVRMHVEERSPAFMMWFTLEFTGGRIHLRTTAPWESPAKYNNFDLTGWRLVFKTRIGRDHLPPQNVTVTERSGMDN